MSEISINELESFSREAATNLASDSAHIPLIQKIIIDAVRNWVEVKEKE